MTPAEQAMYDTCEKDSRSVLDAARAAATAIGSDINSIIGQVDKVVVKDIGKVRAFFLTIYRWVMEWTGFLEDPRTKKMSYKRGSGVVALITSIIFAFKGDAITSLIYFAGAVTIAIVCGLTKT